MDKPLPVQALVFDVFGTVVDWRVLNFNSPVERCAV